MRSWSRSALTAPSSGTRQTRRDHRNRDAEDFRVSITNSKDEDACPISSFTWLLVAEKIEHPAKRKAIAQFLRWVLTEEQKFAAAKHYAPLPGDVAQRVLQAVSAIHWYSTQKLQI